MKVLILAPHVIGFAPGQRVRVEAWADDLRRAGHDVRLITHESPALNAVLHGGGNIARKGALLLRDTLRTAADVLRAPRPDCLIVHRESALIGPELLSRAPNLHGVPLILDIDDPVFVRYRSPDNGWASALKFPGKTRGLIRRATIVAAINDRIGDYARGLGATVSIVPNYVDTARYLPPSGGARNGPFRMLWIGSRSTVDNLQRIAPPLERLAAEGPVELVVVGPPEVPRLRIPVEHHVWSPESEVAVAATCHVGLVPVPDSPWADWKFYYKLVQYMAAGLPIVADDRGSNRAVLESASCGIPVRSTEEWAEALRRLRDDERGRRLMGKAARGSAKSEFDIARRAPVVEALVERAVEAATAEPGRT